MPENITPEFTLSPDGYFKLSGRSVSLDSAAFFRPIIWQIENISAPTVIGEFKLEYFDSATAKSLHEIFKAIKAHKDKGAMVLINWHSEKGDADHRELGEDFEERSGLKFVYKTY